MKLAFLALLAISCGQDATPGARALNAAITGGSVDAADPAAVALITQAPLCGADATTAQVFCTGMLIAPRVVLTAAHCTSTYPLAGARVYAGTNVARDPGQWLDVAEVRVHPGWTSADPRTNDVALLVLEEPAPMDPIAPLDTPFDASFVGATVRLVGFGVDESGQVGVKRQGTAKVTAVRADAFDIAASPAMTCEGDSGGPVLLEIGGMTRVAGVTSFGDVACHVGTNTRVDTHMASFIAPVLAEVTASPRSRASITPGLDTCARACTRDTDCARGMTCLARANGVKACALNGLPPGRFDQSCAAGGCPGGNCVNAGRAGCLCYRFCDEAMDASTELAMKPSGGCAIGGDRSGNFSAAWLTIAILAMRALRRRTIGPLALAALLSACSEPRGNCPEGAVTRGAAPPAGSIQFCEEKNQTGVRSGPLVEWYAGQTPPQKKREGSYKHGKLHGAWVSYYPDGKREREDTYVDGLLEGRAVEYYPSGVTKEEGALEHGFRVGPWILFHENGTKWKETAYSDNSNTQRWTVWSSSGIKTNEGVFVNGLKDGLFTEYHPNGQKASQGTWVTSKKQGKWTTWDDQGKVLSEQMFVDGELAPATTK